MRKIFYFSSIKRFEVLKTKCQSLFGVKETFRDIYNLKSQKIKKILTF